MRSTDDGNSFQFSSEFLYTELNFDAFEFSGDTIILLASFKEMMRSFDNGTTWEEINLGTYQFRKLTLMPNGSLLGILLFNNQNDLISQDFGASWSLANFNLRLSGSDGNWFNQKLFTSKKTLLFSGNEDNAGEYEDWGIWRLEMGDSIFQFSAFGISNADVSQLTINPVSGSVFALTESSLYRSKNKGVTWERKFEFQNVPSIITRLRISKDGDLYFCNLDKLFHSKDEGESWDTLPIPTVGFINSNFLSPDGEIFISDAWGYFSSTDKGNSWNSLTPNIPGGGFLSDYPWVFTENQLCFTASNSVFSILRSIDGGQNWEYVYAPFNIYDQIYPTKWGELFVFNYDLPYRFNNTTGTWSSVSLPIEPCYDFQTRSDGRAYAILASGLWFSDDFGTTWAYVPDSKVFDGFNTIALGDNCIFLGTRGVSVWRTEKLSITVAKITGQVTRDLDQNCENNAEPALQNWIIQATAPASPTNYALTDSTGHYRLGYIIPDSTTTELTIEVQPPNALWQPCDSSNIFTVSPQNDTATVDFSVGAVVDCPLLTVSVGFWPTRPCFSTNLNVSWCNEGTQPAPDATLAVQIDTLISVVSASMPIVGQSGDTLFFNLGDVPISGCGALQIVGTLSCEAAVGQTVCCSAAIKPDSICFLFPGWSGATLQASSTCEGDTVVHFSIKNIGSATSASGLDYVVVEDQVLLKTMPIDPLGAGQTLTFSELATGKTLFMEADQEPNHPVSHFAQTWVEGCGTGAPSGLSLGFINQLLGDDGDPFTNVFCREVTASYDPNSKEALPAGYGPEHFIRQNQSLDYTIHFQNTGTDTAFQVVLRDTLSPFLEVASIRVGASSHAFDWEIYGPGILKFIFKNIKLPDSTTNPVGSNGWVSFQIDQKKDLPLGTVIRNHAGIYFDFNPPILTNETWHTLGENFIVLDLKTPPTRQPAAVKYFPNPMSESVNFQVQQADNQPFTLKIFLPDGREVQSEVFTKNEFSLKRNELLAGIYFFKIMDKSGVEIGSGRLLAQ